MCAKEVAKASQLLGRSVGSSIKDLTDKQRHERGLVDKETQALEQTLNAHYFESGSEVQKRIGELPVAFNLYTLLRSGRSGV